MTYQLWCEGLPQCCSLDNLCVEQEGDCSEFVNGKDTGDISKNICQNGYVCQNDKCPISFGYSAEISCCTKRCNKTEIQALNPNGTCCRRSVIF